MEDVSPTHIEQRLASDGLSRLTRLLQTYKQKVVIAGSYTFAIHPEEQTKPEVRPGDMDLWIPWLPNNESPKVLGAVLACLVDSGYSEVSSRHQNPDARLSGTRNDSYKRMDDMIDTIYTVREPPLDFQDRRKVQILLLQKAGGRDAEEVIRHFDLNLSRQYYDGFRVWRPRPVGDDVRAHRITLNTTSAVIRDQSFGEWVRTLRRIHKYIRKGFTMSPSVVSTVYELVPAALATCEWYRVDSSFALDMPGYIREWNQLVKGHPRLPSIAFTVEPPGRYVSDVRLVLCENPIVPAYPEKTRGEDSHPEYLTKHYNRLLDHERKSVTQPTGTTGKSKSIYLDWTARSVHVSSLVPYPSVANGDAGCPPLPRTCLDPYMQEQVDVSEFIQEGKDSSGTHDHFVFYFQPHAGPMRAYGIPRAMLENAQTFVPCVDLAREWGAWSEIGSLLTLGVEPGLSFNLPTTQLMSVLNPPRGPTRHLYRIVSTQFSWDRSRRLHVDNTRFEGGFANNCQDDTARTISFLEHILCFEDEDWFKSVPVHHVDS